MHRWTRLERGASRALLERRSEGGFIAFGDTDIVEQAVAVRFGGAQDAGQRIDLCLQRADGLDRLSACRFAFGDQCVGFGTARRQLGKGGFGLFDLALRGCQRGLCLSRARRT